MTRPSLACLTLVAVLLPAAASADSIDVYIGTYTGESSRGIYSCRLDTETGQCSPPVLVAELKNPSFLAVHPERTHLYAVSETADVTDQGQPSGTVHAFRIERSTGSLQALNHVPSGGGAPCHLSVSKDGRFLLTANYTGGNVSVTEIADDGSLGRRTAFVQHHGSGAVLPRQAGPHAHSIHLDPQNHHAYVADLGLDQVLIYRFDQEDGSLSPNEPAAHSLAPGSGPRHLSFHPRRPLVYVINEIDLTIAALAHDPESGALKTLQTLSTLPPDVSPQPGFSTAEVVVHPSGRFLYGSNRGHDSITVYAIDPADGRPQYLENTPTGGQTPRNFAIEPSGRFLLAENQASDAIVVFAIDPAQGTLRRTPHEVAIDAPVCVRFVSRP